MPAFPSRSPLLGLLVALGAGPPALAQSDGYSDDCTLLAAGCSPASSPCYLAPVHATLLPNGKLLLAGLRRNAAEEAQGGGNDWGEGGWVALLTPPATDPVNPDPPGDMALTLLSPPYEIPEETCTSGVPPISYATSESLFCGGHTLLESGNVFLAGGTREMLDLGGSLDYRAGLPYAVIFDRVTGAFQPNRTPFLGDGGWLCSKALDCPSSGYDFISGPERWYPTATRRADGRILVTAGSQVVTAGGLPVVGPEKCSLNCGACVDSSNLSVELHNVRAGTAVEVSEHGDTPTDVFSAEYTHVWQLPTPATQGGTGYDVLMLGESGVPVLLDDSAVPSMPASWFTSSNKRLDSNMQTVTTPNDGCGSVMMPFLGGVSYPWGSVVSVGGESDTEFEDEYSIYDPYADDWIQTAKMNAGRHKPSPLLMPTGEVLFLAGYDSCWSDASLEAEYLDPTDYSLTQYGAEMVRARGYHTVAVLLPDGRILLGGGRRTVKSAPPACATVANYVEKADFQYYYPPYWYSTTRPEILSAPSSIEIGETFNVQWSGQAPGRFALTALGSFTHSFDQNQRYIELATISVGVNQQGDNQSVLAAPSIDSVAPPGYYLLWLVDAQGPESGVCELASVVKVRR